MTDADLVAARLRIEELETLDNKDKGELVDEVEALKVEREGLKKEMSKLETRIAELVVERDTMRRSHDRVKGDIEALDKKSGSITETPGNSTSKTSVQSSEDTEPAKELQTGSPPSVRGARNNRVILLEGLANIYDHFQTTSSKVSYDKNREIGTFKDIAERWRIRYQEVITRRSDLEENTISSESLIVEIEEMFEDMYQLQTQLTASMTECYGWQNRWRQRKLMHEYALEDLEICRRAAPDIAGDYWRLRQAARSLMVANDGSDQES